MIELANLLTAVLFGSAGLIAGLFGKQIADRLLRWAWGPKFRFATDQKGCKYKAKFFEGGSPPAQDAIYFRVRIENIGDRAATNCQAFLHRVEFWNDGHFTDTEYCDTIPLTWSYRAENGNSQIIEIPSKLSHFLDLARVEQNKSDKFLLCTKPESIRQEDLFRTSAKYRFTVSICCNEAPPETQVFCLDFQTGWPTKSEFV